MSQSVYIGWGTRGAVTLPIILSLDVCDYINMIAAHDYLRSQLKEGDDGR